MKISNLCARLGFLGVAFASLTAAGCYVVPIDYSRQPTSGPASQQQQVSAPTSVSFSARLYPSNELAIAYGMVIAQVSSDLNGKGAFSTAIGGEAFTGEATRTVNGNRSGIANGAGNRGSYISCRYQMNTATLGTGQCKHSNGAEFSMHVGG